MDGDVAFLLIQIAELEGLLVVAEGGDGHDEEDAEDNADAVVQALGPALGGEADSNGDEGADDEHDEGEVLHGVPHEHPEWARGFFQESVLAEQTPAGGDVRRGEAVFQGDRELFRDAIHAAVGVQALQVVGPDERGELVGADVESGLLYVVGDF